MSEPHTAAGTGNAAVTPRAYALVVGLFFGSGAAGLVYQVLWMRHLGLFLGSDTYGVSIILSAFMGGLALGSLAGGRLAQKSLRPLFWYGVAELGIGVFALLFSGLLASFDPLLARMYPQGIGTPGLGYQLVRVGLAGGALLIPTALMGATLPLVLRQFVRGPEQLGRLSATFYAVNTLGALAGTLTAGFALLPYLGMSATTLCVAALNLAIGAVCILVGARSPIARAGAAGEGASDSVPRDPLPGVDPATRERLARAAIVALGVSGFASFAFEVVWTRILLMSASATVYSFATTLACFLFGIFFGSRWISKSVDRHPNPASLFAALELGIGVSVALLCLLLHAMPGVFGRLLVAVAEVLGDFREHALVVSTVVASLMLLAVPTTLLGATFAVALRVYTTRISQVGRSSGTLYASNTLGAILGSLIGGLVLIPAIGTTATLAVIAGLFTAIGVMLARVAASAALPQTLPPRAVAAAIAAAVVLALAGAAIPYRPTLNFNQQANAGAELLYHADGIQNTVDIVKLDNGVTALVIGGNVEADDSYRQRRHFVLKGHLPLMLLEKPRDVLIVGLGMGITLQATARHPGLERIDVVELSPEIVAAQAELREINGDVLSHPLVNVRIDDGRAYLKRTTEHYDMITADPIHPKISRVGYLYTREYYASIREKLRPGGVVCQWMPIYQIAPDRLRSALASFLDVFPNATLWYVESHALLVATRESTPIDYARVRTRLAEAAVRDDLASIEVDSPEALFELLILGPDELGAFANADPPVPLNTDDYPYLEYFVPRDLFYPSLANVEALTQHLADPRKLVAGMPAGVAARLGNRLGRRAERMLAP